MSMKHDPWKAWEPEELMNASAIRAAGKAFKKDKELQLNEYLRASALSLMEVTAEIAFETPVNSPFFDYRVQEALDWKKIHESLR